MIARPRGTRDFLPDEMERRRDLESRFRTTARLFGYREVATPTFEETELFTIRSGEGIIQEMYAFPDKGGRSIALRPELTAPVIRMFLSEARVAPRPLRWCYFGSCFRYERPQKGRYREFWQFGAELIGVDTALADAEVITLASHLLSASGIAFTLHIGHLGFMRALLAPLPEEIRRQVRMCLDKHDLPAVGTVLRDAGIEERADALVSLATCRSVEEAIAISGLPDDEAGRIRTTLGLLDAAGIAWTLDPSIARGLDYYTGMVFEAFAENLGAENQVMGGGAYRLSHLFGGEEVPSVGFAIGFDRVMVALGETPPASETVVAMIPLGSGAPAAFNAARAFREAGIRTEVDLSQRGMGAKLASAAKGARFAVIIGDREAAEGTVTLRDLVTGEQESHSLPGAINGVRAIGPR